MSQTAGCGIRPVQTGRSRLFPLGSKTAEGNCLYGALYLDLEIGLKPAEPCSAAVRMIVWRVAGIGSKL